MISELSNLWGPEIAVAEPVLDDLALWSTEEDVVARAVAKRQDEFAKGRSAARAALAMLGHPRAAIPAGPDRAPIWPAGIIGSITHTKDLCLAALARDKTALGIGIDAEKNVPLSDAVADRILNLDEQSQYHPQQAASVFSAKEATYKALYPIIREVWGFDAMSIRLDLDHAAYHATLHRSAGPFVRGATLTGVLLQNSHHILTGICINDC